MGTRRGPRPKPTELKRAEGIRPDRINSAEPASQTTTDVPTPPAWLSAEAKAVWWRDAPSLHGAGVLTQWDVAAFAMCCHLEALVVRTAALLEAFVVRGRRDQLVTNPAWRIHRDALDRYLRFAQEFGLTPSARSTIRIRHEVEIAPVVDLGEVRRRRSRS